MARYTHDVIILGGGSGGLTAAVGCAQLGMKTALIDKERLGGDCLHFGCVPSKALLKTAATYRAMSDGERFGLPTISAPPVEISAVNRRIAGVIAQIAKHDSPERFEKLGAEVFLGQARFRDPHTILLDGGRAEVASGTGVADAGVHELSAKSIIVATGSSPRAIPIPGLEEAGYITNLDAFSLPELPSRLVTIGGGPIGVELSQAFGRLGSKVTILDIAPHILPLEDEEMAAVVAERVASDGIAVRPGVSIARIERAGSVKRIILKNDDGEEVIEADEILLAVGRKGNTDDLELQNAGVTVEKSFVTANSKLQSSQKHILAVGDVNGRLLFTHVAGSEGSVAVRRIALHAGGSMNYQNVPWVTYTDPELASIGYNEKRASEAGIDYEVITQPLSSIDRAQAEGEIDGRIKMLLNRKGVVIGTQIVGYHAGELLLPSLFAVSSGWKARSLMGPIYPYPTLGEIQRKAVSSAMAGKLFNDRVRGILRFLFRYRGTGGEGYQ